MRMYAIDANNENVDEGWSLLLLLRLENLIRASWSQSSVCQDVVG